MRLTILITALALAGCAAPATLSTAPAAAPVTPAGGSAPQAAAAPAPAASTLTGVARYFNAPMAGARITARPLGGQEVLATAVAATDGTFRLDFGARVPAGTAVQVMGEADGHRVANLALVPAPVPAARQLLATQGPVVLDTAQTAALLVLAPRLLAAFQLGTDAAREAAIASLAAAAEALGSASAAALMSPDAFDAVVAHVFDAAGQVLQTAAARAAVAAAIPETAVAAITSQADALAAVIRQEVAAGHDRPADALIGALPIGPQTVAPVFAVPSGGDAPFQIVDPGGVSSGAGGGSHEIPVAEVGVDLAASPADGLYGAPTAPASGEAR